MLCLPFIAFFQIELHAQNSTTSASVTIGRQGSDCRGRGICNFNISTKSQGNTIVILNNDSDVTLIINCEALSDDCRLKLVSNLNKSGASNFQTFIMEDAFELPASLTKELDISTPNLTIPKGTYPMQVNGNNYSITFKLE